MIITQYRSEELHDLSKVEKLFLALAGTSMRLIEVQIMGHLWIFVPNLIMYIALGFLPFSYFIPQSMPSQGLVFIKAKTKGILGNMGIII